MADSTDFLPFARPSIGDEEIEAVVECLKSGWLTTGHVAHSFEQEFAEFIGARNAVAVNSATAGLHLALESLGVRAGQKVITTPYTFTASAEVIRYFDADPVFVDIDETTMNISVSGVREALAAEDDVAAIMPVHFAGLACDMTALTELARRNSVPIVEDAAHALPSTHGGQNIGAIGDVTVFSFYVTKTLATGEGGMVVTDDDQSAARMRKMRLHGIDRDVFNRYTSNRPAWYYEVVAPGFKYNLTDVAAAIGREQLKKVRAFRDRREEISRRYTASFSDLAVRCPSGPPGNDMHSWHLYVLRLRTEGLRINRDELIDQLAQDGIGTSVHFIPLHLHPYWRDRYSLQPGDFPNAFNAYQRAVSLPLYPGMTDEDVDRVIESVRRILIRNEK